jgi:hypothetical protein
MMVCIVAHLEELLDDVFCVRLRVAGHLCHRGARRSTQRSTQKRRTPTPNRAAQHEWLSTLEPRCNDREKRRQVVRHHDISASTPVDTAVLRVVPARHATIMIA